MEDKILACKCGSTEFLVSEANHYPASLKANGTLMVDTRAVAEDNGFDEAACTKCGKVYSVDEFENIEIGR